MRRAHSADRMVRPSSSSLQTDISIEKDTLQAKSSEQVPKMPKPLRVKSKPISETGHSSSLLPDPTRKLFRANTSSDQMPKMPKPLRVKGHRNSKKLLLPDPIPKISRARSSEPHVDPPEPVQLVPRSNSSELRVKKSRSISQRGHSNSLLPHEPVRAKVSDQMVIRKSLVDPPDPVQKVSRSNSSDHVVPAPRSSLVPSSKEDNNNNIKPKQSYKRSKGSSKINKSSSTPTTVVEVGPVYESKPSKAAPRDPSTVTRRKKKKT
jgi:hypothetical protein